MLDAFAKTVGLEVRARAAGRDQLGFRLLVPRCRLVQFIPESIKFTQTLLDGFGLVESFEEVRCLLPFAVIAADQHQLSRNNFHA
jgi:hypothetical protein